MSLEKIIREKLEGALPLHYLEIVNESHKHQGHAGDDGSGESHFNLMVVSDAFLNLNRLARQRLVHKLLGGRIIDKVHALSIQSLTVKEYSL